MCVRSLETADYRLLNAEIQALTETRYGIKSRLLRHCCLLFGPLGSDVNKDLTLKAKAKAKAKDLTFEGLNRELDI